jgi:hypothetical protein
LDVYSFAILFPSLLHLVTEILAWFPKLIILYKVKQASKALQSEMVEILHGLQLCISFLAHIGKKISPRSGTGVIQNMRLSVCVSAKKCRNF